jgi:transcription-repair coupling factor (superfamily II helicase)
MLPALDGGELQWSRLYGSARGLAIAQAARQHAGPVLVVMPDARTSYQILEEIRFYIAGADLPLLVFPDWESLPYDVVSPHPDIISRRLLTLHRLPELQHGIVIATASTLMHKLCPPEFVSSYSFLLRSGDRLDPGTFRERLVRSGYAAVSQVMEPGEFAIRGGLIDLFPMGAQRPYRVDLFGEEIESLRSFDPQSQRSLESLQEIRLLPAREFAFNEEAIRQFRQAFRARFAGDPQRVSVYRDVSQGLIPAGAEYYLPLFHDRLACIFDFLPGNSLCVLDQDSLGSASRFATETEDRYQQLGSDVERPILPPADLFLDPQEFADGIARYSRIVHLPFRDDERSGPATTGDVAVYRTDPPPRLPVDRTSEHPYEALFHYLESASGRVLVVASSPGRRETLKTLMHDHGLFPADVTGWAAFQETDDRLAITVAEIDRGMVLPETPVSVITETQLYGERAAQRRRREGRGTDTDSVIRSLEELRPGDPVVHEEYGVGRYRGLSTLDVGDGPTEFLTVEYADGDKVYVPVVALHLISRYTATNPEHAPLHKLGSDTWEKAKRRAQEKAYDAAAELLEIHALRAARTGHRFPAPDEQFAAFSDAFPFEETPDQERAIDDVVADMSSPRAMDRLVCGDVGFGKTEVAMRAAFLAVHGATQVVLLAPTTLLAQQHFQNFSDRFADLPVRIELLSRFRTKAEQQQTLDRLADGQVDIVVGTHRLLQDDVRFRNLGLVIIDEEHRFGVRQKERLKKLRADVDILTLTATPIPRTLNMAMAELRDISIIATPPQERLSIKTVVLEWNDGLIREACLREIRRGGQVFFLHNEVRTMERAFQRLHDLVPEAGVQIAHGQMPESELEQVMLDFYHQRFNVLLCSTIIESGIDIPTANTIIIERADKFGLAQLHQLRGRVGRSHHRAYAYLIAPPLAALSTDARKRLQAIEALEELGAGFALASHDLEIRGAGELLGESQSGEIDEVGFAMYSELLNRAVQTLREGKTPDLTDTEVSSGTEINLHAPALLPEDYIPDIHMRLVLYKRISNARSPEQLVQLREEFVDRFGVLPKPATLLFEIAELRLGATALGIRKIDIGPRGARIDFARSAPVDPGSMISLLQSVPGRFRLEGPQRLRISAELPDAISRLGAIREVLASLKLADG